MNLHTFHVIGVMSNPVRYKSRVKLAKDFIERMQKYGVNLHIAECAFGDRPFELVDIANTHQFNYHQFRSKSEIWQKESLINATIRKLPQDFSMVAWVDMDVAFARDDVFVEAWHALQHYDVIQLFSDCVDLGPNHEIIQSHKGFCYIYSQNRRVKRRYEFMHPGFCWAMTRQACEDLTGNGIGPLLEAPLGSADHHMALSLVSKAKLSLPGAIHPNYAKTVLSWQARAEKYIRGNIGYVPGLIYHFWHGKKKDRRYVERWDILTKNNFDPEIHVKHDWQGLLTLTDASPAIRDDIREYLRQRNEDSVDTE